MKKLLTLLLAMMLVGAMLLMTVSCDTGKGDGAFTTRGDGDENENGDGGTLENAVLYEGKGFSFYYPDSYTSVSMGDQFGMLMHMATGSTITVGVSLDEPYEDVRADVEDRPTNEELKHELESSLGDEYTLNNLEVASISGGYVVTYEMSNELMSSMGVDEMYGMTLVFYTSPDENDMCQFVTITLMETDGTSTADMIVNTLDR